MGFMLGDPFNYIPMRKLAESITFRGEADGTPSCGPNAGNADATFTTTSFIYQALTYDNGSTGTDPEDALIITFNLCGDLA